MSYTGSWLPDLLGDAMRKNATKRCAVIAALCVVLACGGKDDPVVPDPVEHAPDFALLDVNPNSSRHAESVSPRDYLNQVSVWYFGHAT